MASVTVVSVFIVCGVVSAGGVGPVGKELAEYRPPREKTAASMYRPSGYLRATTMRSLLPRVTTMRTIIPYEFTEATSRRPQEKQRVEKEPPVQRRSRYEHGEMYPLFIPVKFDVNRDIFTDPRSRRVAEDPAHSPMRSPPRLIMDKDFNIRFDNPYIVPVTKPLAFVLDGSDAQGRSLGEGPYKSKMMIPFPVLVQARSPTDDYRDYREEDDGVEHRANNEDDFYLPETQERSAPRKANPSGKPWRNSTSEHSGPRSTTDQRNPEDPNPNLEPDEENFNESDMPSVYPSKIFEEMYRSIPKYPLESTESREPPYDETKRKYSKENSSSMKEPPRQRPRVGRPVRKYPFGGHVFSATSELEWVTHANSSKTRQLPTTDDTLDGRIIIHDAEEDLTTTTIEPLQPPGRLFTSTTPKDVLISEQYWRDM